LARLGLKKKPLQVLQQALRIGLTGGIGSGKSTVAGMLMQCGAYVVDADAISKKMTSPGGAGMAPLHAHFGSAIFTAQGAIDRALLRQQVFNHPQIKANLEAILHPLIAQECERLAHQAPKNMPIVFDVPLLIETPGWTQRVDRIVVVDCSPELQIKRVMQRSAGWSRTAVLAVMTQQASRPMRRAAADEIIDNENITLEQLQTQVQAMWLRWCSQYKISSCSNHD
jgi:dephospho-CoA kinase